MNIHQTLDTIRLSATFNPEPLSVIFRLYDANQSIILTGEAIKSASGYYYICNIAEPGLYTYEFQGINSDNIILKRDQFIIRFV